MPLLYESVYPQRRRAFQLETKRYPIPWPEQIGCETNIQVVKLRLPYNETKIHNVKLVVNGELCVNTIGLVSVQVVFSANGTPVLAKGFTTNLPYCLPFNLTNTLMGLVTEGENELEIELRQSWHILGCISDVHSLKGYIELTYSGPEPPPPEFEEEWWEKALRYGTYGMIVAVVLGCVYVGSKLILERRDRG